jgi:hypothetical protein
MMYQCKSDKGIKGGSCNVTACQRPNSAVYFNKSTKRYYCAECAHHINWPGGRADTMALYGTPLLCELDEVPVKTIPITIGGLEPAEVWVPDTKKSKGDKRRDRAERKRKGWL